jgi:hypothetical protein
VDVMRLDPCFTAARIAGGGRLPSGRAQAMWDGWLEGV